jgi:hypothetical protein
VSYWQPFTLSREFTVKAAMPSRQGFKPLPNSLSPLKRTEDSVKVVGFNRLKLLARDLSLWREGNEAEVSDDEISLTQEY